MMRFNIALYRHFRLPHYFIASYLLLNSDSLYCCYRGETIHSYMADLEDIFLKKNVPGRYSSWTEENDDKKHCNAEDISDSETDDEFYFQGLPNSSSTKNPPPPVQQTQPQLRQSGNTGVKGVLADYREAQQEEQLAKEEDNLEKLEAMYNATHHTIRKSDHPTTVKDKQNCSHDGSSSSDLDDSDDDDEFLKRFRNQRIAELQQSKSITTSKQGVQTFGTLSLVTPQEYVQIVDDMDNTTSTQSQYLIVHLYHSTIHTCQMLQSSLEKLSQSMIHTQFIQVNALEANSNLDTICLPAILIYSKGELIHNLVRFTDDLPKRFSVDDVRQVLGKLGIDD